VLGTAKFRGSCGQDQASYEVMAEFSNRAGAKSLSNEVYRRAEALEEIARAKLFKLVSLCRHLPQGVLQGALEDENLHLVLRVCAMW
jgi:hypothetical protein